MLPVVFTVTSIMSPSSSRSSGVMPGTLHSAALHSQENLPVLQRFRRLCDFGILLDILVLHTQFDAFCCSS